ncbi:MAG: bacillithiol biosynthesis cysteine-adding enzyme BshC [Acidobacteriota bacterium]
MPLNPPAASSPVAESPVRIPVDIRRFSWLKPLAGDYAYHFDRVAEFYAGDPSSDTAWAAAIAHTRGKARQPEQLAAVLASQQARRAAPAPAREAAASLADPDTIAVVTGQQAGLFGGPLYTLHKALTALALADEIARRRHVRAVAVFWIDAEDHDWEEVRSCTILDVELAPRTVSLPADAAPGGTPVGNVSLTADARHTIDELARILPATEFTPALVEELRRCYAPGVRMADAFGRWLEHLLGARGLIVYDASDPASKPLAAPVFAHELRSPGETARFAHAAGLALTSRGYHAQVQTTDDAPALFRLEGASRRPVRYAKGRYTVGDEDYAADALVREAGERPAGFSPNVLLRPVVQDTLFPTVCYVAGPSELAYLGQLRTVYAHFGVPMPLIYPRASATLVDSAALRFMLKYDVPLESLQPQDDRGLNAVLKAQMPEELDAALAGAGDAIDTAMARVIAAVPLLDATLERTAQSTATRMRHELETLQGKTVQAAKRRDDTLRRQFARARALAFPGGHPQERAVGLVSFLNQYGPALVDRLAEELPLELGRHWMVAI